MFKNTKAFSSFSVDNLEKAKQFYGQTLQLDVSDNSMGVLDLHMAGGGEIMIYPKPNHSPASFTVLNFRVDDIEKAVAGLGKLGVVFEQYDMKDLKTDPKGIVWGKKADMGPNIAWFKDPAGNILSVIEG